MAIFNDKPTSQRGSPDFPGPGKPDAKAFAAGPASHRARQVPTAPRGYPRISKTARLRGTSFFFFRPAHYATGTKRKGTPWRGCVDQGRNGKGRGSRPADQVRSSSHRPVRPHMINHRSSPPTAQPVRRVVPTVKGGVGWPVGPGRGAVRQGISRALDRYEPACAPLLKSQAFLNRRQGPRRRAQKNTAKPKPAAASNSQSALY